MAHSSGSFKSVVPAVLGSGEGLTGNGITVVGSGREREQGRKPDSKKDSSTTTRSHEN